MKEVHKCSSKTGGSNIMGALLRYSFPDATTCGRNAKYFENDMWYCGIHAPSKITEEKNVILIGCVKGWQGICKEEPNIKKRLKD